MRRRWRGAAAIGLVFAGCSPLAPRPDRSLFVVLTPLADTDAPAPRGAAEGVAVGVGPIDFPAYLRRPEMATRAGTNQVEYSETVRWAEPLDTSFAQVLARDLAILLGTDRVVTYPWARPGDLDYTVGLTVLQFERSAGGDCRLAARVVVRDGRSKDTLESRDLALTEPAAADEGEAAAAALSRALGKLSREVASAILRVQAERPRPRRP